MKIRDISLRGKLVGGFLLVILIFTSGSAVSLYNMAVLQETEHEMASRSADMNALMHMEQLFSGLYPVIADSVINRNFEDARNNFSQQITTLEESLSGIQELADTGQERTVARNIVERTVRFRDLYLTEMLPLLEKSDTVARRSQDSISILKMELLLANAYTFIADAIINGKTAEAREVLNELLLDVDAFGSQLREMADTEAERLLARELEAHMSNYFEYALNTIIPEIETGAGTARLRVLDEEADRLRLTATEDLSTMSASLASETLQALADEEAVRAFDEEVDTLRTEIFSDFLFLVESLSAERHEAEEAFDSRMASTRRLMTIITVFALAVGLIIGLILANAIVRAMTDGIGFAAAIARGDLKTELAIDQRDEIGKLADSMRTMQKELQYKAGIIESFAQGDLSVEVRTASEVDGLGTSLQKMRASLNEVLGQVARSVYQVNSGSDQVAQASQTLSQGAAEQASSVEEISSSLTELNSQAQENAKKSSAANTIADTVAVKAGEGAVEMRGLHEAMQQINSSSEEITKVVKIIDDLAFQINLLALNANVEAARAIANGNNAVGKTSEGLKQIASGIDEVTVLLQEISSASREQALGIDQITTAVDQIGEVVQSNTASAEESAAASEELASQAKYLESMIGQFTLAEDSHLCLIGPGAGEHTSDV